jgi:hypothetical protein
VALRIIGAGAVISCVGIAAGAMGSGTAGAVLLVGGWLALIYGIHRFGRSGAES